MDFSPLSIPSFIPSNILPPVLNTFLTACQALLNTFLNQFAMPPKTDVIAFHAPCTPSFTFNVMVFHTLDIVVTMPFQMFEIVFLYH